MLIRSLLNFYHVNISLKQKFSIKLTFDEIRSDEFSNFIEECKHSVRYRDRFRNLSQYKFYDGEFSPIYGKDNFNHYFKLRVGTSRRFDWSYKLRSFLKIDPHQERFERQRIHENLVIDVIECHPDKSYNLGLSGFFFTFYLVSQGDKFSSRYIGVAYTILYSILFLLSLGLISDIVYGYMNRGRAGELADALYLIFSNKEGFKQDLNKPF